MATQKTAIALLLVMMLAGCGRSAASAPKPTFSEEMVLYDWEGDMPESVLNAFTQEYDIKVTYMIYESQEAAIDMLKAGKVYDVVVMESRFIPLLANQGLLAEIDYRHIPNFKNISANFRDLIYDPDNRYSIPYNWGTTGLVVRSDLVPEPVTRWADLWDPRYAGKVAIWGGQIREVIALTLKSMGYSANSEDPAQLEMALVRLLEIRPYIIFLEDYNLADSSSVMASGQVWVSMGYSKDFLAGRELNPSIIYVLPEEGALLWGDTFVIPASSPHKSTAELFLNFLLRPEISAQMINGNHYPMANVAAEPFVDPAVLNDPAIYPSQEALRNASLILPLSPEGQERYDALWKRFLAGEQPEIE